MSNVKPRVGGWFAAALFIAGGAPATARAEPGTHPVSVSVWDARASSVMVGAHAGFRRDGHFHDLAYAANFSSTSGVLSAQFGAHFLSLGEGARRFYGVSGSGAAVFVWPLAARYDNGVPRAGLGASVGLAPAALIAGEVNYFTAPLVVSLALPLSPAESLTLSPWGEVAPSLDLDTEFAPVTLNAADYASRVDPVTGDVVVDPELAAALFRDAVRLRASAGFSARVGLAIDLHLSERASFALRGAVVSLGDWPEREATYLVGAALIWRWDRIVPAVLPAARRLADEDCADIAERYGACLALEGPNASVAAPPPKSDTPAVAPVSTPAGSSRGEGAPAPAPPLTGAGPSETQPWSRPPSSSLPPPPPRTAPPPPRTAPTPPPPPRSPAPPVAPVAPPVGNASFPDAE